MINFTIPLTGSSGHFSGGLLLSIFLGPYRAFIDEPTADLDPGNRRKLINLIKSLCGARIIVSHDLDFIRDTCKRTLIVDHGRIVADDLSVSILSNENLLNSYGLELPLRLQEIS